MLEETMRLRFCRPRTNSVQLVSAYSGNGRQTTSRVEIDFRVEGSKLILSIVDDGIGFDPSIESEGHGVTSMKRRAAALGSTLEINSQIERETVIRVTVPLDRARGFLEEVLTSPYPNE